MPGTAGGRFPSSRATRRRTWKRRVTWRNGWTGFSRCEDRLDIAPKDAARIARAGRGGRSRTGAAMEAVYTVSLVACIGWTLWGVVAWRKARERRRRWKLDLCPGCGYDIRMNVDRCPECGTQIPEELFVPDNRQA